VSVLRPSCRRIETRLQRRGNDQFSVWLCNECVVPEWIVTATNQDLNESAFKSKDSDHPDWRRCLSVPAALSNKLTP